MNYLVFILAFFFAQEIPLKPKGEFEIKLDYQFKSRPAGDHNTVNFAGVTDSKRQKSAGGVLPYLTIQLNVLSLAEERMKMRIATNLNDRPVVKKVSVDSPVVIDLGFTDDMKDRVTAHEYTLTFIGSEKQSVNRIVITVAEDGSFHVNGEKRGKF